MLHPLCNWQEVIGQSGCLVMFSSHSNWFYLSQQPWSNTCKGGKIFNISEVGVTLVFWNQTHLVPDLWFAIFKPLSSFVSESFSRQICFPITETWLSKHAFRRTFRNFRFHDKGSIIHVFTHSPGQDLWETESLNKGSSYMGIGSRLKEVRLIGKGDLSHLYWGQIYPQRLMLEFLIVT